MITLQFKYKNKMSFGSILAFFVICFSGCTDMDHTYKEFWEAGEKVYPAPADSVTVFPGKNRLVLRWLIKGDPNVTKAKIFWNYQADSLEIPINSTGKIDTVRAYFDDMPERSYSFTIFTFDDKGNKSIPVNVVGNVFGPFYENTLLPKLYESAVFIDDVLKIKWGTPADTTSIGTEVYYMDTSGNIRTLMTGNNDTTTIISDYDFNADPTVKYRTAYLPDSLSLDTFYTDFTTVKVKGPAIILPKSNWTATASSYDQRHGTARMAASAIDDDPGTIWVNQVSPQTYFPHDITIDMGEMIDGVEGIQCLFGNRNETPQSIEIHVSDNGTDWNLMGIFPVQKSGDVQTFEFSSPQNIQYFKIVGIESYGSPNIVIYEIWAFTR